MNKRILCGIAAAYAAAIVMMVFLHNRSQAIPWHEKYPVICHALGRTEEGVPLTNSKEAFLYNYRCGQRVFEADIQISSDEVMVLRHDWVSDLGQAAAFGWQEVGQAVTAKTFIETPIYEKYTPMTLEDWFAVMRKYPDIYLVTDTKYSQDVKGQFRLFADTAVENGYEDVLSRVIVQLYYKEMYDEVVSVYPFENFIWTLYYTGFPGGQEVSDFMKEHDIPVLVMPSDWWDEEKEAELKESGVKVYVHTVNDEEEAKERLAHGISGIYSDDILPETVRQWQEPSKEAE